MAKDKRLARIAQWFRDLRLHYKLTLIYALAGFLPLAVVLMRTVFQIRDSMLEQEHQHMQSYLYQAASTMENQLDVFENLNYYITSDQTIANVLCYEYHSVYDLYQQLTTVVDPMIASMKYFHHDADQVTIYLDRTMINHGDTVAALSDIIQTDWYAKLQTASGLLWYVDEKEKKVLCAGPMLRLSQEGMKGVLCIRIRYDSLFGAFEKTRDSNYGIFVLDQDNNVLYENSFFEEAYDDSRLTKEALLACYDDPDCKYEIVEEICDNTGWTAYLYKPKHLVITSMAPAVRIAILAFAAFLAATIAAVLLLTHFLTKRVERLRNAMELVREGNLETTITADSKDEIGELAEGFLGMLGRINILIHEVYEGKIKEKEYEMKALQAQINPHFLYNTLSMINWKAIEAGARDISKITLALSTFYRTALNKGKNITTLQSELNNMRSYLEIERMMHDDSFDVSIEVEEAILPYATLNLLLQPLIENAIVHGIDVKTDGRGCIRIEGRQEGDEIIICVEDNGVGMEPEEASCILTKDSQGYGVRNVNERIRLYYGEAYALHIESKVGIGTKATIRIPKRLV